MSNWKDQFVAAQRAKMQKVAGTAPALRVVIAQPIPDNLLEQEAPVQDEARVVEDQLKGKQKKQAPKFVPVDELGGVGVPFQEVPRYQEPFKPTLSEQDGSRVIELIHAYMINMGIFARKTQANISKLPMQFQNQPLVRSIYGDLDSLGQRAREFSRDKEFDKIVSNEQYQVLHSEVAIRRYKTMTTLIEELFLNVMQQLSPMDKKMQERGMNPSADQRYIEICNEIKDEIASVYPEFFKLSRTDIRDKNERNNTQEVQSEPTPEEMEGAEMRGRDMANDHGFMPPLPPQDPNKKDKMHNYVYKGPQFGQVPGWDTSGA